MDNNTDDNHNLTANITQRQTGLKMDAFRHKSLMNQQYLDLPVG